MRFSRVLALLALLLATLGVAAPAQAEDTAAPSQIYYNQVTGSTLQLSKSWDVRFSVAWGNAATYDNANVRYLVINSKANLAHGYFTLQLTTVNGPGHGNTADTSLKFGSDGRWSTRVDLNEYADYITFLVKSPAGVEGRCAVYNWIKSYVCSP